MHLLLILHSDNKLNDTRRIDEVVSAELPDSQTEPQLYETVKKCMIHGPCGEQNPHAPCMENNTCQKKYPKEYQLKLNLMTTVSQFTDDVLNPLLKFVAVQLIIGLLSLSISTFAAYIIVILMWKFAHQ